MQNAAEFLNNIFEIAGIPIEDEKLVLLTKAVSGLEVSDEMVSGFHNKFLTEDVAKKKLKGEIIAAFSDFTEAEIISEAKALGMTDEEIEATKAGEKNLSKRTGNIIKAVAKRTEELHKKGGNAAIDEYRRQMDLLKQNLETEKEKAIEPYKTELGTLKGRLFSEWEKNAFNLPGVNLPEIAKVPAVKAALSDFLTTVDGELSFDFETGKAVLFKKGKKDTPLFHENKELDFQTALSLSVQKHKLLDIRSGGDSDDPDPKRITIPDNGDGGKMKGVEKLQNATFSKLVSSMPKQE